ncbi:AcrB/AcrD/AcrF family protein [Rhodobacterales bacterium HKCCE2091]|nr:AcrB/AcrD/AcrF family protein [Rhodobacterales bacterium HKCCE2091]
MREVPARASGILSYFTRHATAANLLLALLVIAGLAAAPNLRAQYFPDVIVQEIDVSVSWDGAGAEDVDRAIVAVLEPTLLAVEGVTSVTSRAREGRASMELEFEPGWDMGRAADDVEQAVGAASDLPEDADDPVVSRSAWRDRVTDVVITGPVSPEQLGRFADEFVGRLFAAGVTRATVTGVSASQVMVEVPSSSLYQHDITMAEIAAIIAGAADTSPAGAVDAANARIRTGAERRSAADIAGLVLRRNADGSTLTIGDIATVTALGPDRDRALFVGGNPAVSVRVDRSDQGDAIGIQHQVEVVAAEMQATLPTGVQIDLIRTRAEFISARLDLLMDNGLIGLGLVLVLLFLFLNARTAFWVAMGIPVSMLATLAIMFIAGQTLNMISLFALIITLGIVVDDAIVVGEHADFRARRLRESPVNAAENAARRMAAPVFSATLTTVIAFAGLTAIGGRFGEMIAAIPFAVIAVLMASLIECFLILPNHMAHALSHSRKEHWYDWPSRQVNRGFTWVRDSLMRPLMRFVIWARYPVLAGAIALLATQAALFIRGDVTWRFFNAPELSSVSGNFAMLDGAGRDDTLAMMREMQRAAEAVAARYEEEYGLNPMAYVLAEIGGGSGRGLASAENKDADLLGSISIEMIDADLRPYSSFAFVADLQEEVRQLPLVEEVSFRGWRGGPGGDAIDVELVGADISVLKEAAEALKAALAQYGEVSALEDNLAYDRSEISLTLTPQGEALGFDIGALGSVLRNRLGGIEAATFPDGVRTGSIRVELPDDELTADFLERMLLRSAEGEYVPLADIVRTTERTGFSTVLRENGTVTVSVTGDLSEDDPARAAEIMAELRDTILPQIAADHGVGWQLAGLAEQENEFLSDALLGLGLCLAGIYLVLAWVFASWTRPMVVMAVIPFGLIGAIWGHALWDVPLSMFSVVGLIGMTGIIINDSIVLVTTIDEYAENRGIVPAIVDGVADRLRPVLLTTATTVLGLAPLLYEGSQQAQFLKPTVITLVYGLGFGMFIVLFVVPAILALQQDVGVRVRAVRRVAVAAGRAPGLAVTVAVAAALSAVLFALTLGAELVTGAPVLSVPGLPGGSLVLFIVGSALVCLVAGAVGAAVLGQRSGRQAAAG